ncbi:MAG: hypothetical protein HQ567_15585 [Candidatus Nealsonbacteria bacterium]|nr:hypothetical protein [Candidatus Nealsonbacteria bacterium]
MNRPRLKGAFAGCKWCHGSGCLQCDIEREKAFEARCQPILSVTHEEMRDPTLGPLIKDAIGADALVHAFGPDGGGMAEVEENCAVVSLLQTMRKAFSEEDGQADAHEPIPAEAACNEDGSENAP